MCWLCDAEAQGFYGSDLWNGAQLRGSAEVQDVSYVAFSYLLYNESSRQFIVKNGETELVGGQTVTERCVELIFEKVSVRKTDRSSEEFTSFRGVLNFLFFFLWWRGSSAAQIWVQWEDVAEGCYSKASHSVQCTV